MTDLKDLTLLWRSYQRFALPQDATQRDALVSVLQDSWSESTVVPHLRAEWNALRPHYGQADVTVLLVQHLCGGDIVAVDIAPGVKHFYNRLPLGEGYYHDDLVVPMTKLQEQRNGAAVISRPDLISYSENFVYDNGDAFKKGTQLLQRYNVLHERAHFVMARAIR